MNEKSIGVRMSKFRFEKHHFVNTSGRTTTLDDCVKLANEALDAHEEKMKIENIKTGLKLSEAIKLIEENEGAEIRIHTNDSRYCFGYLEYIDGVSINCNYDVKLPPPKSVTVTRADLARANAIAWKNHDDYDFDLFCKELGL